MLSLPLLCLLGCVDEPKEPLDTSGLPPLVTEPCPELADLPRREFRFAGAAVSGQVISGPKTGTSPRALTRSDGTAMLFWLEHSVFDQENPAQLDLAVSELDPGVGAFLPAVEIDNGDRRVENFQVAALDDGRVVAVFEQGGPIFEPEHHDLGCVPEGNSVKAPQASIWSGGAWSFPSSLQSLPPEVVQPFSPLANPYESMEIHAPLLFTNGSDAATLFEHEAGTRYMVRLQGETWSDPVLYDARDPGVSGSFITGEMAADGSVAYLERESTPIFNATNETYPGSTSRLLLGWVSPAGLLTEWELTEPGLTDHAALVRLSDGGMQLLIYRDEVYDYDDDQLRAYPVTAQGPGAHVVLADNLVEPFSSLGDLVIAADRSGGALAAWAHRDGVNHQWGSYSWFGGSSWSAPEHFTHADGYRVDDHAMALAPDGRFVLLSAEDDREATSRWYDPGSDSWTAGAPSSAGEAGRDGTATVAGDGTAAFATVLDSDVVVGIE